MNRKIAQHFQTFGFLWKKEMAKSRLLFFGANKGGLEKAFPIRQAEKTPGCLVISK